MLKTQVEIEQENLELMLTKGMNEYQDSKQKGNLSDIKACNYIIPYYVGDLANSLGLYTNEILQGKAKIKALPAKMLQLLDPLVVAHHTVRTVVNTSHFTDRRITKIATTLANFLETEYTIVHLEKKDESLKSALVGFVQGTNYSDVRKIKMTKDLISKYHKDIAKKETSFMQLALKAIQVLCSTYPVISNKIAPPLCDLRSTSRDKLVEIRSWFHIKLKELITENDGSILGTYHTPMVERPLPWASLEGGGFYTPRFKYPLIQTTVDRQEYKGLRPERTLKAVNRLQDTKWRINQRILEVMESATNSELSWGDLPTPYDAKMYLTPCPHEDVPNEHLTEEQKEDRKVWRQQASVHYKEQASRESKVLALRMSILEAKRFRKYDSIYFAYFLDFRGRAYPKATFLSPQGTDYVKSLLQFSEGKRIETEEQYKFFCMQGANTFGHGLEKKTFSEKVQWVKDNHHAIIKTANNPYEQTGLWHEADEEPWLFLAFCFEYRDYHESPDTFESRLAVAMDGSCNGLQHLSAILLDEVGGESVNLTNKSVKGDIYSDVRDETLKLLEASSEPLARSLVEFGITRKAVKRPVMIVPYAGTQRACRRYIDEQFKKEGGQEVFGERYKEALTLYTSTVWEAINIKILKGREIMSYLSTVAREIIKETRSNTICWTTPNGFPVKQKRVETQNTTIETPLGFTVKEKGSFRTVLQNYTEDTDIRAHATGIAPNFVHSLDACHLQETVNNMSEDCSYAMIHDSFGVHVADSPELFKVLREVFYKMYKDQTVLNNFITEQPVEITSIQPSSGTLELSNVLEDEFFFS